MKPLILIVSLFFLFSCEEQKAVDKFYKDGYKAQQKLNKNASAAAIEIDVLGKQGDWIFTYTENQNISCHESKFSDKSWKVKELDPDKPEDMTRFVTVPVNTLINFNISSEKVLHSLAIAAFRVKKDAPVGKKDTMQFTATKLGTYLYTCNEVCGIDKAQQMGYLRVVSKENYKKFLDELSKKAPSKNVSD